MLTNKYNANKNKRNKSKAFKSHTDINNYNNFLLDLDKKQRENEYTSSSRVLNSPTGPSPNFKRENVKIFIKDTDNNFKKLGHNQPNFSGINQWESFINAIQSHLEPNTTDPNAYEPIKDKKENLEKTEKPVYKNKVNIVAEINNINDLLSLIDKYPDDKETEYNINMTTLHKIKAPLTDLNNMIGMKDLKENIVDQIIFYIQNLHTLKSDVNGNDFMHTVIYGPPGTGKTEIAKIIGSIFSKMGILTKGTFKKVTRADLIAGYLGQTALKTRDVVKECLGGVLFIDEAYALGNEEKRDSFSKECIDTLCESLSDHKDNLMVIIAGYETDLNNCFFNYNQGLNSRFTWRFKTDEYTAEDLYNIFLKKVKDGNWSISADSNITVKWFEKNKTHFKFYGRDVETLFAKTKIAHSRRVFCLDSSVKKMLILKDIDKGLTMFLKNEDSKEKEKERYNKIISSMYV
jgi:Cdc6-like AAA superfamily ATPase